MNEIIINNLIFIIVSTLIIVLVIKYISNNIYLKLIEMMNKNFESELKKIQDINDEKIIVVEKNSNLIDLLSTNIHNFNNKLYELEENLTNINMIVDKRKELESEIIKLKNIIKRIEKRNR